VDRLRAQLKLHEDTLRTVEAERAALTKDLLKLTEQLHALQNAIGKRPARGGGTGRPSDRPATGTTPADDPDPRPAPKGTADPLEGASKRNRARYPGVGPGSTRSSPEPVGNAAEAPATADRPANVPATPASTSARVLAEGGVDVISLATAYVDAQAAADIDKARTERLEKLRDKGFVSQEEIETELRRIATAQRKFKLLRAIAEAELDAAKAELDAVARAIDEGVLPKSKRIGIEARIRVLQLILEPAEKTK
jgi:hypothetical protein